MSNYFQQNWYLRGLIKKSTVITRRHRDGSKKEKSCAYKIFFTCRMGCDCVVVCNQISDGRIFRGLKKIKDVCI